MKRCSWCKEEKSRDAFSRETASLDGLQSRCRACNTARKRVERANEPWKTRRAHERYKAKHPERWTRQRLARTRIRKEDLAKATEAVLTIAACEVCGGSHAKRRLHADHCHASRAFRGVLCSGCNIALGGAKDNPDTLRALVDYLERRAVVDGVLYR